ncbi:MAG: sigma-70 family RNA polymerase sigma factor [Steroidobacteraceae bacterium]|jgi:RNA polymerase sigma-70 factor (ECF subfamily)
MVRFARGDGAAFEVLYRRHETRVFRFLLRTLHDEAGANDVMQDVWFAVARGADRYTPTAKFTTWLFTIAHHRMVDAIRARRPTEVMDLNAESGEAPVLDLPPADARTEPLTALQIEDQAAAVLRAVEQLPVEQRSAFLLQAEGGLSVEEVAAATGTSFETAKSRLRYARAKLREWLWEFA